MNQDPDWSAESSEDWEAILADGLLFEETNLPPDHRSGFVAVVGRPNVGKSTLLNTYLGTKIAIVSPKAQTTRKRLLGILTLDEAQLIFIDTPGVHEPHHKFGQFMVEEALQALPEADLILWLVDGTREANKEDRLLATHLAKMRHRPPVVMALNKCDLLAADEITRQQQAYLKLFSPDEVLPISAAVGDNCDQLQAMIIERLPLGPRFFPQDQLTDQHLRFIAAEMIREASLNVLHQEVPHALLVQIEDFQKRSATMTYIEATIYVERESQKPIVIGQGGKTIKRIGQLARAEIEPMLESKAFLELRVKVRPNWRRDEKDLKRFGYSSTS